MQKSILVFGVFSIFVLLSSYNVLAQSSSSTTPCSVLDFSSQDPAQAQNCTSTATQASRIDPNALVELGLCGQDSGTCSSNNIKEIYGERENWHNIKHAILNPAIDYIALQTSQNYKGRALDYATGQSTEIEMPICIAAEAEGANTSSSESNSETLVRDLNARKNHKGEFCGKPCMFAYHGESIFLVSGTCTLENTWFRGAYIQVKYAHKNDILTKFRDEKKVTLVEFSDSEGALRPCGPLAADIKRLTELLKTARQDIERQGVSQPDRCSQDVAAAQPGCFLKSVRTKLKAMWSQFLVCEINSRTQKDFLVKYDPGTLLEKLYTTNKKPITDSIKAQCVHEESVMGVTTGGSIDEACVNTVVNDAYGEALAKAFVTTLPLDREPSAESFFPAVGEVNGILRNIERFERDTQQRQPADSPTPSSSTLEELQRIINQQQNQQQGGSTEEPGASLPLPLFFVFSSLAALGRSRSRSAKRKSQYFFLCLLVWALVLFSGCAEEEGSSSPPFKQVHCSAQRFACERSCLIEEGSCPTHKLANEEDDPTCPMFSQSHLSASESAAQLASSSAQDLVSMYSTLSGGGGGAVGGGNGGSGTNGSGAGGAGSSGGGEGDQGGGAATAALRNNNQGPKSFLDRMLSPFRAQKEEPQGLAVTAAGGSSGGSSLGKDSTGVTGFSPASEKTSGIQNTQTGFESTYKPQGPTGSGYLATSGSQQGNGASRGVGGSFGGDNTGGDAAGAQSLDAYLKQVGNDSLFEVVNRSYARFGKQIQ